MLPPFLPLLPRPAPVPQLGMLSDCVRSFKAHIRHAARETADVRGSAYDDLGVSLLRTGNSMSGQNSRLVYSQAKWAFSKSTELRGSNAINQVNVVITW